MEKKGVKIFLIGLLAISLLAIPFMSACGPNAPDDGAEPVVIGLPTSLGYWFGRGAVEAATLAVEEINAAGGVSVGGEMRPFKLVTIDTRDSVPGVPTADSLLRNSSWKKEFTLLWRHPTVPRSYYLNWM